MVIVFCGEKGGTGKSTLAINIAAKLALEGKKVLLMDTDNQETSSSWCYLREEEQIQPPIPCVLKFGSTIMQELNNLKQKYTDIVVDCGGRDSIELRSVLLLADKVVIPLRPAQFDLWTLTKLREIIKEIRLINKNIQACIVLNAAKNDVATKAAKEYINEFNEFKLFSTIVKERDVFYKSATEGRSVCELIQDDPEASLEIHSLYEEIVE